MTRNNTINQQRSTRSGDREKFKALLRRRLTECGWKDQVKLLLREAIRDYESQQNCNITCDMLVTKVTPRARALVPDTVKKELLQKLKAEELPPKDQ